MNEHGYIRSIHRRLSKDIHAWKINARFAGGVPDCWYSATSGDLWAEYKYLPKSPARRFTPAVSALQKEWLNARLAEGRQVAVIVGCPAGGRILLDGEWNGPVAVTSWLTPTEVAQWITRQTLLSHSLANRTA